MEKPKKLSSPVLFITRTYPPVIGGMETLSYYTIKTLSNFTKAYTIKNPYGKKGLPFFAVWAFFKAIVILLFTNVKVIHLSDGVLAPIGVILRWIFPRAKVVSNIHGLDVAYVEQLPLYRYTNLWAIKRLDKVIAVSQETKDTCLKYGIPEKIITVIPNGTDASAYFDPEMKKNKNDLWQKYFPQIADNITKSEAFLMLSLGRIVKRKGLAWFLKHVMPSLPKRAVLIIASSGPDLERVKRAVEEQDLQKRVFFLGFVSDNEKKFLLNVSDVFIMPNIKVKGDREGFGITVIEASSCELIPVVSDLEGLKDAVKDGESGLRLPSRDEKQFIEKIQYLMENSEYRMALGKKARRYVKEHFDWSVVGKKYLEELKKLESA